MNKQVVLALIFLGLTASFIITVKPVSAVTQNSWASKAPMHEARGRLGVAVVNGKIYAIGGDTGTAIIWGYMGGGTGHFVGANEEYDPSTDTWTYKKSMPTARYDFGVAVYQNKIYCIGGEANGASINSGGMPTAVNEVYDPATDTWETKAPLPTARQGVQGNVVNGKIYLIGGTIDGANPLNVNEAYDPATDSWTTKASAPSAVMDYVAAVVNNNIYVVGGWGNTTLRYDPASDSWRSGSPPPSLIVWGAAGATTGTKAPERLYIFTQSLTQTYNPEVDGLWDSGHFVSGWGIGSPMPTARAWANVAVVNDVFYVIGGDIVPGSFQMMTPSAANEQYMPVGYGTVSSPSPSLLPVSSPSPSLSPSPTSVPSLSSSPPVSPSPSASPQPTQTHETPASNLQTQLIYGAAAASAAIAIVAVGAVVLRKRRK